MVFSLRTLSSQLFNHSLLRILDRIIGTQNMERNIYKGVFHQSFAKKKLVIMFNWHFSFILVVFSELSAVYSVSVFHKDPELHHLSTINDWYIKDAI